MLPAGEQDAGHLGVHVAQGEVQAAGGKNLRASVMPDDTQPVPRVSEGDVGDQVKPGDREHSGGRKCADAPRCGLQGQSAQSGGGPPPVRSLGRYRERSRGKHALVSTLTFGFHKGLPIVARLAPQPRGDARHPVADRQMVSAFWLASRNPCSLNLVLCSVCNQRPWLTGWLTEGLPPRFGLATSM